MKNKRLMYLVTSLNLGGAEMQVYLLASHMQKLGHKVIVVSLIEPKNFIHELNSIGIEVVSLDMTPGRPSVRAVYKFIRKVMEFNPCILHTHMFHANILGRVSKIFLPNMFGLISTAHSINEYDGSLFRKIFYKSTAFLTDFMTNVSKNSYEKFVNDGIILNGKGAYIENGVDSSKFYVNFGIRENLKKINNHEGKFLWIFVGRLAPVKNIPLLIEAIDMLSKHKKNFMLQIIGEGPEEGKLRKMVSDKNLNQYINFVGLTKNTNAFYAMSDAFVISSLWEGMPMVLLESIGCGLPFVATNVGGIPELNNITKSGIIVENNSIAKLAEAMLVTMNINEDDRNAIGEAGSKFMINVFGMDSIVEKWNSVYDNFARN